MFIFVSVSTIILLVVLFGSLMCMIIDDGASSYTRYEEVIRGKKFTEEFKWEAIKNLYKLNPNRWIVEDYFGGPFLKCTIEDDYIYIKFNYIDWKKFTRAYYNYYIQLTKQKEIKKNQESTIAVIKACQMDIDKEKEKAKSLKEKAINNFDNIAKNTNSDINIILGCGGTNENIGGGSGSKSHGSGGEAFIKFKSF